MGDAEEDGGQLPRPFGAYTLAALLGRGGMGEVFLAMRGGIEGINRRCVVKTLRPGFGDDREYVTRFLDEARIVVQLLHRNICPVFDVGKADGRYYLAMEYIAGRDLRTVSERLAAAGRPFYGDVGLALHVVCEVLEALEYAHSLQDPATGDPLHLVHRDVSPHNVMIGFDGDVRLIDFGLAASTLKVEHTAPNVVMGKVSYMSPEQICGDPLDAAADQFAAAVMAVELCLGERFYGSMNNREVYVRAAKGGYRPPRFHALPEGLRVALDRALSGDRRARFASCSELRQALDAWRYQAGLRGDGSALRAVMREVFVADIAAERGVLARAAQSSGLPADSLQSRPAATAPPALVSDTVRVVKSPSLSEAVPDARSPDLATAAVSASRPRAAADHESGLTVSSPRALATAAAGDKRARAALLGLGAVAAVALVAMVVVGIARSPDGDDPAPPVVPVPRAATLPAPAVAPRVPAPPAGAVIDELPPAPPVEPRLPPPPARAVSDEVAPAPPPVAPEPPLPPTDLKRPRRPSAPPAPPPAAPPQPPAKVPTKATPEPPPKRRIAARIDWLKANCSNAACLTPIVAREHSWATLAGAAMPAFKAEVAACVELCLSRTR